MSLTFRYASWNMKNLSNNSLFRLFRDFETESTHKNLTAYINTIKSNKLDIMGILEVTLGTGQAAVIKLAQSIKNWNQIVTKERTFITRKGEHNAIVYNADIFNGILVNPELCLQTNFPQKTKANTQFLNRVPVLFTMGLKKPANVKKIQIITWHAPQPKHVKPGNALKALTESINDFIESGQIDKNEPLIISGDFNFSTDPTMVESWKYVYESEGLKNSDYLRKFKGLFLGKKTTLVAKDPARYKRKPSIPADFADLLANAYDTILINTEVLTCHQHKFIQNHFKKFITDNKIMFYYRAPGDKNSTQIQIQNANKISDHCAVAAELKIMKMNLDDDSDDELTSSTRTSSS